MKFLKNILLSLLIIIIGIFNIFIFSSCKNEDDLLINLYITETQKIEKIKLYDYLCGVVAAEISPSSPIETLKTQAILARTFTLNFINNNKSKYENADISNDITEAQAYNKKLINNNIKKAVKETSGLVIKYNNELINAWFHANSGGQTAFYNEVFELNENSYPYIKSVKTFNKSNLEKWTVSFSKNEILNTLRNMGQSVSNISSFNKGEIGQSGRCITFIIGGKEISANTFRINIGSTRLKSTLIDNITIQDNNVIFSGFGYGHGVGLDQNYAIYMANQGKKYDEIINYFYENIIIEKNKN